MEFQISNCGFRRLQIVAKNGNLRGTNIQVVGLISAFSGTVKSAKTLRL
jgi:hypothetical protein